MKNKVYKRACARCNEVFESQKNTCYCPECYKANYRERYQKQKIGRIPKPMGRKAYPLEPEEARLRFITRRKEIDSIKNRTEWKALIEKRFTDLLTIETEIYEWATRYDNESYYEKNKDKFKQKYQEKKAMDESEGE